MDVVINRRTLLHDMLNLYNDHEIVERQLRVEFLGEQGDDLGGLTKDLFTSLWSEVVTKYFRGENAVVPFLPLYQQATMKEHYTPIGRILCHTASLLQIIPIRLSRTMLVCLIYGNESIGEEMLLSDFLLFLNPMERTIVQLALTKFSDLNDRQVKLLTDMFGAFGYQDIPRVGTIRLQIATIARNELVDKPAPLVALMRKGIPEHQFESFWSHLTIDDISTIMHAQMPTGQKVVDVLNTGDAVLTQQQENAMYFLKSFILTADHEELAKFLWFVTGSTVQPLKIDILFQTMHGAARRPIAHTCSNTLELSDNYWSFQDMREEFRHVLSSPHSFEMNMI